MGTGFICNICGSSTSREDDHLHREMRACTSCGSNARFRALMVALTKALFGKSTPLFSLSPDKAMRGFGCSDTEVYSKRLEVLFNYKNTFLHAEPRLDLCDWDTFASVAGSDFAICTDVLEHTILPPPIALQNIHGALKANGVLILSAPTYDMARTIEKYPDVLRFENVKIGDRHVVVYETTSGSIALDTDPIYHGGPGSVLEMRLISHHQLINELSLAGFEAIAIPAEDFEVHGATWPAVVEHRDLRSTSDGRVILARKSA